MNTEFTFKELERVEEILLDSFDDNNKVVSMIRKFLCYPSKRIRTILTLLYLKSNCCQITDEILKIISAGEIIHNASLLHDDVLDDAEIRRGKTTISKELSPKVSVIAGDLLVSKAIKLIMGINNENIINIFVSCTEEMCKAEINQYILRGKKPNLDEYINICRGKTASLFVAILKAVSEVAGIDSVTSEDFGEAYGIVFQLKNDLEPKSIAEDKFNGIFTINNIMNIEKTNILIDNYKEKMRSIIKDFPENIYTNGLISLIEEL